MTSSRVTKILDDLRAEEAELQGRVGALCAEVKTAQSQLALVRKAMSSLSVKPTSKANQRANATKDDVIKMIRQVLESNGAASEGELKALVEKQLTAQGKSRSGFAMCFKHALLDNQFVRNGMNLGLATATDATTP